MQVAHRLFPRVVVVAVLAIAVSLWLLYRLVVPLPSELRARATVEQILFTQGRVLLRNELSELFASDDKGRSWHSLSRVPGAMRIARGNEIWSAHGWPGHHEGPSARIWRSLDRGGTWSKAEIDVSTKDYQALHARLPAMFLNEPDDEPLLAMSDLQLVRPVLVTDPSTWERIGRRIPSVRPRSGTINTWAVGQQSGHSIYVAVDGTMFISRDRGMTWVEQRVPPFNDAQIRCTGSTCYALLMEFGAGGKALMKTEAGTNEWTLVSAFELSAVTAALAGEPSTVTVARFGASALVPTSEGVYVSGFVDAGDLERGVVLLVKGDGALTRVGQQVPGGLWVLERAPDGTLWAGGTGAYRLEAGEWVQTWSAGR